MGTKEKLKEIFEKLLENYEEYEFCIRIYPEIDDVLNWDGEGTRATKYVREITITDKFPVTEHIKKEMW